MEKESAFLRVITDAGLLLDSSEIEHVIGLIRDDTTLLVGDMLSSEDSARLTACGPAALIADRIRKTIRGCFPVAAPWPLETAKAINSARDWYCHYQHGDCLIEALALAHHAASYGLGELDLWRLRARLEQLTNMALFSLSSAPPPSSIRTALKDRDRNRAANAGLGNARADSGTQVKASARAKRIVSAASKMMTSAKKAGLKLPPGQLVGRLGAAGLGTRPTIIKHLRAAGLYPAAKQHAEQKNKAN